MALHPDFPSDPYAELLRFERHAPRDFAGLARSFTDFPA